MARMSDRKTNRKGLLIGVLVLTGVLCGVAVGVLLALFHDLPQIRSLESYRPSAVTRIYSSDDVLLAELFLERRLPVPLDQIPTYLKEALIATEDRSFYRHGGVDPKGIARAIVRDILAGEFVEGASTLTQQLAKTLFLSPQKTLNRKIKEALLAIQIERRYTKDEILALYLNQVYFGSGAYGVEVAARSFFGKPAKQLTLAESALIAGMPKAPSRYSPLVNSDLAVHRRNVVLRQMKEVGVISDTQYRTARQSPLELSGPRRQRERAPYFVDYVTRHLEQEIGASMLYKGGLTVHTSLIYRIQEAVRRAIVKGLEAIEHRARGQGGPPKPALQGAAVVLDTASGAILAMAGGREYRETAYNRAVQAKRQSGSAFKPIVYALAVERGFPQNYIIRDAPVLFEKMNNGNDWQPQNFSTDYQGDMTLRKALATSRNIPAVRLNHMLGPGSAVDFAHQLGIESPLVPNLSLVLGTSEVSLMELTSAYAAFANHGISVKPHGVIVVVEDSGKIILRGKSQRRAALSRAGAAVMTDMLQAVIQEGTGRRARRLPGPLAGKTGTTDNFRDALFIGFSPTRAAGVWVGRDLPTPIGPRETGARAALPIWMDVMTEALAGEGLQYFDIPDDVVRVRIDPETGAPVDDRSPKGVGVLFKRGTEPQTD
ncbi:Multimodular transpeptidase-transglycosylase (EC (EC [Olavius algarvensis associated proteobacterium Delta 3]|nr:Multimodular transpeptidase-transglycosylase (EC (EC [Olavius algarvensis associated proteobacterium Delta 3]